MYNVIYLDMFRLTNMGIAVFITYTLHCISVHTLLCISVYTHTVYLYIYYTVYLRDVNVMIFLDFSFRYDSVHQKY